MSREPQLASVEMLTGPTMSSLGELRTTQHAGPRTTTDFTYPSPEVGLLSTTTNYSQDCSGREGVAAPPTDLSLTHHNTLLRLLELTTLL